MSVLVAFEDIWMQRALETLIQGEFQLSCQPASTALQALGKLQDAHDGFDFVCCPLAKIGETLIKQAVKNSWKVHFFVETAQVPTDPLMYQFKEWLHFITPQSWADALYGSVWKVFKGVFADTRPEADRLSPIHPALLLATRPLPCSVYEWKGGKAVKRFSKGDTLYARDVTGATDPGGGFCVRKAETTPLLRLVLPKLGEVPLRLAEPEPSDAQWALELAQRKLRAVQERQALLAALKKKGHTNLPADPDLWEALLFEQAMPAAAAPTQASKPTASAATTAADASKADLIKRKAQEILQRQAQAVGEAQRAQAEKQRQAQEAAQRAAQAKARKDEFRRDIEVGLGETAESFAYLNARLGFPAQAQDFSASTLRRVLESMEGKPELIRIFKPLNRGAQDYITRHSLMISVLGPALASQLKGVPDTLGIKLCWAGLLHDVLLTNPKLAQISTLKEFEAQKASFTDAEAKLFREHPTLTQELAGKVPGIPPDVDLMVSQHHELPDGTGFPRNLGVARLSPQAIVFIVCHDLADFLSGLSPSQIEGGLNLAKFMERYASRYQQPAFRRVLSAVPRIQG